MKKLLIIAIVLLCFSSSYSQDETDQDNRVITTSVPFTLIAPDARAGALGEAGVASSPDANSMHWNPAKYAFIEKDFGFAISYSPWLRKLVSDINLAYVSGFYRIDERSAVAASLGYFSLGDITFTNDQGQDVGTYRPNEFLIDGTYSRKFSPVISGAVAARFIYSNLTQGQFVQGAETTAGTSIAADVAIYYEKDVDLGSTDSRVSWGINISNIGNKISYSKTAIRKDFIPTNLRFGGGLEMFLDDYNSLTFLLDVNKLLVPTPPVYDTTFDNAGNRNIKDGLDPNVGVVKGIIQSWYDAPGGFSEEMREFNFGIGMEYWYAKQFSVRGGFFYEDKTKGNRKFATVGAGLRYNVFGLDLSYLIPIEQQNPLENTLRFTLVFNFDSYKTKKAPEEE